MTLLRIAVAIWVALSFVLQHLFSPNVVGYTSQWVDGKGYVAAGSHPALLGWAAGSVLLFTFLLRLEAEGVPAGIPSLWRRFCAFLIDFWFSLAVLASLGGTIPLWIESERTGKFSWHFERNYSVPTDDLLFLSVIITMGLMFLYFVWPLTKGAQTIGCFILRLRVAPPFGAKGAFTFRQAARRVWLAFTGVCSLLFGGVDRDSEGRTPYDRETNSTVLLIKYE